LAEQGESSALPELIEVVDDMPRGISYAQVGKTADYGSFGARYFVEPEAFRIIALDRYDASGGSSEEVMGAVQEAWFVETLQESEATWKLWGNAYTLSTRRIDLSSIILPGGLGREHQLSADDWDGMPNARAKLLASLSDVDNLVALTGDSHSFFVSDTGVEGGQRVLEFVCGAMSSATYQAVLRSGANGVPGVELLAPLAAPLISMANPHIAFRNIEDNGFAVVTASEDDLKVVFHQIPYAALSNEQLEGTLDTQFSQASFRVEVGSAAIEQSIDGEFMRWNRDAQRFE
jgi:alkaline phosphatase D